MPGPLTKLLAGCAAWAFYYC